EALRLRKLLRRKGQDITMRIGAVEREAFAIFKCVVIRCCFDVVGVLDELRYRRSLDDLVAPMTDVGEMYPIRRPEMREVSVQDPFVSSLSTCREIGMPSYIAFAE